MINLKHKVIFKVTVEATMNEEQLNIRREKTLIVNLMNLEEKRRSIENQR